MGLPSPLSLLSRASRSRRIPLGDLMTKTTISAPANIAFIKYWGARDLDRALPLNSSISMTLDRCVTQCTIELIRGDQDEIWLAEANGGFSTPEPDFQRRVKQHLDRMRRLAGRE